MREACTKDPSNPSKLKYQNKASAFDHLTVGDDYNVFGYILAGLIISGIVAGLSLILCCTACDDKKDIGTSQYCTLFILIVGFGIVLSMAAVLYLNHDKRNKHLQDLNERKCGDSITNSILAQSSKKSKNVSNFYIAIIALICMAVLGFLIYSIIHCCLTKFRPY